MKARKMIFALLVRRALLRGIFPVMSEQCV